MPLTASFLKRTFHFGFRAKTSRGVMRERDSWMIRVQDPRHPGIFGVGEAAPLPGLSTEWGDGFEGDVSRLVAQFNASQLDLPPNGGLGAVSEGLAEAIPGLLQFPSVLFAFEVALLDLCNGGRRVVFGNPFVEGKPIPINGLIWMGGMDQMLQQMEIKVQDGFDCIKLKVGGLDFEKECDILQYARRKYFKKDIELRLDANGAFKGEEAMYKLHELSKFDIHSIEQPVSPGQGLMAGLCRESPIPIALDEELIGVPAEGRRALLEGLLPRFIILKPTLHGGLSGCADWIALAEGLNIGWWMTSALESNIGLNAIAQFAAEYENGLPQGLGTGSIYDDNIGSPLEFRNGALCHNGAKSWDLPAFD